MTRQIIAKIHEKTYCLYRCLTHKRMAAARAKKTAYTTVGPASRNTPLNIASWRHSACDIVPQSKPLVASFCNASASVGFPRILFEITPAMTDTVHEKHTNRI